MDLEVEKDLTKTLLKRLHYRWHEIRYDEIHNRPYLIGKETRSDKIRALYLLNSRKKINFQDLKNVVANCNMPSVTLAIHSDDSTHLFYKCQMGLKSPLENTQDNKSDDETIEVTSDS